MTATLRLRADRLTRRRRLAGLQSDAVLADRMGVNRTSVTRVLSGEQQPGQRFIAALCTALAADLDELFEVVPEGDTDADDS